ncbi:MAG: hypothetical protein ONB46_25560 [candidate division KSB1 bacterium]|nr:hypothetical protein [candidate division KSB1 bacterium]MDZ7369285.1 hypothetical protein [candidate division KSB1 bacterium]
MPNGVFLNHRNAGFPPNAANFSERQTYCGQNNSKAMTEKNEWQKHGSGFSSKTLLAAW